VDQSPSPDFFVQDFPVGGPGPQLHAIGWCVRGAPQMADHASLPALRRALRVII